MYLLKKIISALLEVHKAYSPTPRPTLIMTLLVKNEEDILEENLKFHKAMGVDGFIVTDNNSTDRTPDIIRKYEALGWVKKVIRESGTNYNQKHWVDRMVWMAKKELGADWVINADADEFWYAPSGNLKSELAASDANVLKCHSRVMFPEEGKPVWMWSRAIRPFTDPSVSGGYELSRYSLFVPQRDKVIHRATSYLQIATGNHKVLMLPRKEKRSAVCIYHYPVKGKEHFLRKMINGGRQLEQNPHKHIGQHWRYFYQMYKAGRLEEEYERITGGAQYEQLCRDGYIYSDTTVPDYFRQRLNYPGP